MHDVEHPWQQLLVVLIDVWLAVLCQLPQGKCGLAPDECLRILETPYYHLESIREGLLGHARES